MSQPGAFTKGGKALSRDAARYMQQAYPKLFTDLNAAERVWDELMGFVARVLLAGHPFVLRGIGTLRPYVKQGRKCRHPSLQKSIKVPSRWYLKLFVSPHIRAQFRRFPVGDGKEGAE